MTYSREKLERLLDNTADLSLKRKARRIIEEIDPKPGDKILEVGSGDGYYPAILSRLGKFFVVGLELDTRVIDTAERNYKLLGLPYKRMKKWRGQTVKQTYFVEGDAMKLPFRDNYFNKIIMSEVAEHLPDDLGGLKEVYRVLKQGGFLVLTVPNWHYPFLWDPLNWVLQRLGAHVKSGFFAGIWNQHIRLYRLEEIESVLSRAGFKIKESEVQTQWCLPFNHYLINIGARMIAAGSLPKNVHSQVNKFEEASMEKRHFVVELYNQAAGFMDSLNRRSYKKVGTTVFVVAQKTSGKRK